MEELHLKIGTIKRAIRSVWSETYEEFNVIEFTEKVRAKLRRPTMDGTILRVLRMLRSDDVLNYKVTDKLKGKYLKTK